LVLFLGEYPLGDVVALVELLLEVFVLEVGWRFTVVVEGQGWVVGL
jgi:hypothetical protein